MNRSGSQNTLKSSSNFGNENSSMMLEQSVRSQFMSNTISRDDLRNRSKSPNRGIIHDLIENLSSTQLNAENQKEMVYLEVQHELNIIDKEINQAASSQETEIKTLNEKLMHIEELLDLERKEKIILSEKKRKEFKLFENLMEIEANMDKFYTLKVDLAKEK